MTNKEEKKEQDEYKFLLRYLTDRYVFPVPLVQSSNNFLPGMTKPNLFSSATGKTVRFQNRFGIIMD